MKVPLSWLGEYVDISDVSADILKDKLFSCGFEVEEVINYGEKLDKVVICKILSIEKHPNADKLSVTKVDAGNYGILQIVTNAKNIAVSDLVPVAVDGATLFNGERIFKGSLRGVKSDGMFCGGNELGINDDFYKGASSDGVLVFHDDFQLGYEVKDLLDIEDTIFDISVTANRPDCQSIYGIAREVSAVLNRKLKPVPTAYIPKKNVNTKKTVDVKNEATDLCPKYMLNYVANVKIEESPLWLKKRLFSVGVRSINNLVDITNYVLFEIGQPMHVFDLTDLHGETIIIRRAKNGEKIVTLDNKEFALNENNLVICDKERPVALAGIMGGLNSGVKNTTTNVLFESAMFKRDNIRKSSRALNQRSNSSARFEKGVDAYTTELAMKRAMNLINELSCGDIACDCYDLCKKESSANVITTKISKINGVLGINVPPVEIENILSKLGFDVNVNADDIKIVIPGYRTDIENYADIAEEIIREYGYDKLVPTMLKTATVTNGGRTTAQRDEQTLKNTVCADGFNEIISYSFVSEKENEIFGIDGETKNKRIKIMNPLGEDVSNMRTMLMPSMIYTVKRNLSRKNLNGRLFELAKVYLPKSLPLTDLPEERSKLVMAVFGENENFFTLKGSLENVFDKMCKNAVVEYKAEVYPYLHPTRSASVYVNGEKVGFIGQFNPELANKLDIESDVYVAELDIHSLEKYYDTKVAFKHVPKYPAIDRDLALIVDKDLPYKTVYDCIKNNAGEHLVNLELFDIYEGNQVEKGKKSMAFSLKFNAPDKTLPSAEVDGVIENILNALKNIGVTLR